MQNTELTSDDAKVGVVVDAIVIRFAFHFTIVDPYLQIVAAGHNKERSDAFAPKGADTSERKDRTRIAILFIVCKGQAIYCLQGAGHYCYQSCGTITYRRWYRSLLIVGGTGHYL